MPITKFPALPITLLFAATLAGCAAGESTAPPAPPATNNPAPTGVALRGLITSPAIMAPKAVCWDGGAPGAVAFFTGTGGGDIKVTLTSDGKTLPSFTESAWMQSYLAPTEGHVEISFYGNSAVQPGVVHVRLDGNDDSHLEFDVTYTGKECDK